VTNWAVKPRIGYSALVTTDRERRLTRKGEATRARIVDAAAGLFYEQGLRQTSNENIRAAAEVSGSQLSHYFPDRESLTRAVLAQRADGAVDPRRFPNGGLPDSLASLRSWADTYVSRHREGSKGCLVGSLVSEALKGGMPLQRDAAHAFQQWEDRLAGGFATMQRRQELREDADPRYLARVLLAALQGGLLLAQATGSTDALEAALDGAIRLVELDLTDATRARQDEGGSLPMRSAGDD
jgi:TetR/AcrR family transcriptional repressor of nem operon